MEFELSTDQEALREAARSVLEQMGSVDRARAVADGPVRDTGGDPAGRPVTDYDHELWAALVDQGWPVVAVPEASGGLGMDMVEVALLCEEIGRGVAPVPFAGHVLALDALGRAGEDHGRGGDQREDDGQGGGTGRADDEVGGWSERLAAGDALGCVAWAPHGVEVWDDGPGRARLSGATDLATYAPLADAAVVVTTDAVWLAPLPPDERPAPEPAMDRTRAVARLRLDGTPARRLGGVRLAGHLLDGATVAASAQLLGTASRALEMSVEYAGQRVQFGRPIGSFQAVKHRLADALVDVEGMRSNVYFAAWGLADDQPGASLAASSAKAWCSDAVRRVTATALQVHGGIGFTWEHDLHLYVKRAQLDAVTFGDAPFHRERIAGLLERRSAGVTDLF